MKRRKNNMAEMKEMVKIVDNTKKHPEDRQYLICITTKSGSGEQDSWNIVTGRTEAYEFVKNNIDSIDLNYSFVLVETCPLSERKSIYAFMKYVGDFYSDGFDIEDYIKGDWDEEDYKRINDISLEVNNAERIDMQSFMDGNINTVDLE
jgi:hypothetical protein